MTSSHSFVVKEQKISLWRANTLALKEQITSLLVDMNLQAEDEKNTHRIWSSDAESYLQAAQGKNQPVSVAFYAIVQGKPITSRYEGQIVRLDRNGVCVRIENGAELAAKKLAAHCELSFFLYQEAEVPVEVWGRAHLLELKALENACEVRISLPHRTSSRLVRENVSVSSCPLFSTLRIARVPYPPRTVSALKAALRLPPDSRPEDIPVLHSLFSDGICARISARCAASWTQRFDPFLVLFCPHFQHHRRISIFMGKKASLSRSVTENLIQIRFDRILSIHKGELRWTYITGHNVPVLQTLLRDTSKSGCEQG